jgi:hypothetical protein
MAPGGTRRWLDDVARRAEAGDIVQGKTKTLGAGT